MRHPTRWQYWSSSKLSHKIRKHFGLENPVALTWEGWSEHEEECLKKRPFIHKLTNHWFNKFQDIWMFFPDLWWNIRTAGIWQLLRNIKLFKDCLWNYRAYDYSGLLMFMQIATKDMSRYHREHGHLVRSMDTAKELSIVSKLCERIHKDEYYDDKQEFIRKGNGIFGGEFVQKPNSLPNCNARSFYKLCRKMREDDLKLLGKMIGNKLLSYWD